MTRTPDIARMVLEFHRKFGKDETDRSQKRQEFRFNLLKEEVDELEEEVNRPGFDRDGFGDELADVAYVIFGTAQVHDIDLYDRIVECHRENMEKDSLKTPDDYK